MEEESKIDAELATLRDNDPDVLRDLNKRIEVAKNSANRWTGTH